VYIKDRKSPSGSRRPSGSASIIITHLSIETSDADTT
jgi:hypothetical protein